MTDEITKPEHVPVGLRDTPAEGVIPPTLLECVLAYARETLGIKEGIRPNRGPEIDQWARAMGIDPDRYEARHGAGPPWCAIWLYAVFQRAAVASANRNPCPRTSGAMRVWELAEERYRIPWEQVEADRSLLAPGCVFVEAHGGGKGHVGLVLRWTDPAFANLARTISGNVVASDSRSREGTTVAEQDRRTDRWVGLLRFDR